MIVVLLSVAGLLYFNFRSFRETRRTTESPSRKPSTYILGRGQTAFGQLGGEDSDVYHDRNENYYAEVIGVKQIAAGQIHTIALKGDGTVWGWGSNSYGQLGNGSTSWSHKAPVQVQGLDDVSMIAASRFHSLALKSDGTVWAWGSNLNGQLGTDTARDKSPAPVRVDGLSDVVDIAAGYRFSLALKSDGTVWAWGGVCRKAGTPEFADFMKTLTSDIALEGTYFDPGDSNLSDEDELIDCLGSNYMNINSVKPVQVRGVRDIIGISGGYGHMLALDRKGQVWGWGCNKYGQVGNGIIGNGTRNMTPEIVKGLPPIVKVVAGYRHSLAVTETGELWSWGHNLWGELGYGDLKDSAVAAKVDGIGPVADVAGGHDYTLAVTKDNTLWGWGENSSEVLGKQAAEVQPSPVAVLKADAPMALSAGGAHAVMLPEKN